MTFDGEDLTIFPEGTSSKSSIWYRLESLFREYDIIFDGYVPELCEKHERYDPNIKTAIQKRQIRLSKAVSMRFREALVEGEIALSRFSSDSLRNEEISVYVWGCIELSDVPTADFDGSRISIDPPANAGSEYLFADDDVVDRWLADLENSILRARSAYEVEISNLERDSYSIPDIKLMVRDAFARCGLRSRDCPLTVPDLNRRTPDGAPYYKNKGYRAVLDYEDGPHHKYEYREVFLLDHAVRQYIGRALAVGHLGFVSDGGIVDSRLVDRDTLKVWINNKVIPDILVMVSRVALLDRKNDPDRVLVKNPAPVRIVIGDQSIDCASESTESRLPLPKGRSNKECIEWGFRETYKGQSFPTKASLEVKKLVAEKISQHMRDSKINITDLGDRTAWSAILSNLRHEQGG